MSSITVPRALLQQALEALWFANARLWFGDKTIKKAIDDLQSELAQQEQDTVTDRVAFERHAESLGYSVDPDTRAGREGGYWSSHTHLMWETWQAALAQQEQEQAEPVAWIQSNHLQQARQAPFLCRVEPTKRMSDFVPIFTHPPRREWQGLTPDAVFASDEIMAANASLGLRIDQLMDLVHAIEQALKERNNG